MAFSSSRAEQGVLGDLKYEVYTLTNVADDSSSYVITGLSNVVFASAVNEKAAGGVINVVSRDGSTVTVDAETANDDGKLFVLGR